MYMCQTKLSRSFCKEFYQPSAEPPNQRRMNVSFAAGHKETVRHHTTIRNQSARRNHSVKHSWAACQTAIERNHPGWTITTALFYQHQCRTSIHKHSKKKNNNHILCQIHHIPKEFIALKHTHNERCTLRDHNCTLDIKLPKLESHALRENKYQITLEKILRTLDNCSCPNC